MPYGQWESPITSEALSNDSVSLNAPRSNRDGTALYYLEADRNGHGRIKRVDPPGHVTPDKFDVGSAVYSYGGGAFVVDVDGFLVFTDANTQGVYRASPDGMTVDKVLLSPSTLYGDLAAHPNDARFILAVRQVNLQDGSRSVVSIVCIDTVDHSETVLRQGSDFYSHPRFSLDGHMLCWLEWDHPHMPWTGARLFVATWGPVLTGLRGIGKQFGVGQPRWGPGKTLYYCHDDTGYQQLYHVNLENDNGQPDPQWLRIKGMEEYELAGAEFLLSSNTYFQLDEHHLIVTYTASARSQLALVHCANGIYADLDVALNDIAYDALQRINSHEFLAIGAMSERASSLYRIRLPDVLDMSKGMISCHITAIAQSYDISKFPSGMLSTPVPINFRRSHKPQVDNGEPTADVRTGHAFLMNPTNANYTAAEGELPPCIIMAHGGPTKHHRPSINLESQYFTSRGYVVVLLNHVGSTGYGKLYRDAMDGMWGAADVQDAVDVVQALVRNGVIDPQRVGITGPSAGGYLTLQAVCAHPNVWAGAISVFGISDMRGFARTTHHFESHYDFLLVRGRNSLAQAEVNDVKQEDFHTLEELYEDRSPVTRARDSRVPVLLLQGSEDCVVTLDQALAFVKAANQSSDEHGIIRKDVQSRVELVVYEHEGHGFHLASTKKDSLERAENWWKRVLVERSGV
ncbi:Alpha/Beta hydrolase protein [Truncatella angustata]|uniref:Alpha/Beta hydrolase protein n=1 Tax=Truncatella angustata TaxID=152316 RepID=A0A9P8RHS5_9PEZI|nr:Alpha/Beta hydrolase protein [Truncatella angustata]KAH6640018.1 Alpha/Beta hydrolase protein [Truncatella angustata]KAH8200538.1 hypothetical protein TruAng_005315 [Truncatella angustata]